MARPRLSERTYPDKEHARKHVREDAPGAEVWFYEFNGHGGIKYCAYAWKSSRQMKFDFHCSFTNEKARQGHVDRWFESLANYHLRKNEGRDRPNPFKERDVIVYTWGYDQTNCDFFQVTTVLPKSILLRPIKQEIVRQADSLSEYVVARRDMFDKNNNDVFAKNLRWFDDQPYVKMDCGLGKLWNGRPVFQSHTC